MSVIDPNDTALIKQLADAANVPPSKVIEIIQQVGPEECAVRDRLQKMVFKREHDAHQHPAP